MTNDFVEYLGWLIRQPAGSVTWKGTQRDLVELVVLVAERRKLVDDRGFPLSMQRLTNLACRAVGMKPPCHVSTIVYRMRNQVTPMPPLEKRIHI